MQLDYSEKPDLGVEGMIADSTANTVETRFVQDSDGITPGLLVVRGPAMDDAVIKPPTPTAGYDDAIVGATATALTPVVASGASLTGVIGGNEITPARQLQLVLTANGDFDATTFVIEGFNEKGDRITETIGVPNGGAATINTVNFFSKVIAATMPGQSGTGGSWRLGIAATWAFKVGDVQGVAMYDATKAPGPYPEACAMPVIRRGHVWVKVENAVQSGDKAFVRSTINVNGQRRGAFRSDDDSGRAGVIPARFVTSAGIGELAKLELDLYAA